MSNYFNHRTARSRWKRKRPVVSALRLHRMNVKVGLPRHRIGFYPKCTYFLCEVTEILVVRLIPPQ